MPYHNYLLYIWKQNSTKKQAYDVPTNKWHELWLPAGPDSDWTYTCTCLGIHEINFAKAYLISNNVL